MMALARNLISSSLISASLTLAIYINICIRDGNITYALVLHQWFNNRIHTLYNKRSHHCVQILVHYPNVLAKNLKSNCLNYSIFRFGIHCIWILSCLHSSNALKAQKLYVINFKIISQLSQGHTQIHLAFGQI